MRKFDHKVVRQLRRLLARPADKLRQAELEAERRGRQAAKARELVRAFALHGIKGHHWEEFEE